MCVNQTKGTNLESLAYAPLARPSWSSHSLQQRIQGISMSVMKSLLRPLKPSPTRLTLGAAQLATDLDWHLQLGRSVGRMNLGVAH